MTLHFPTCRLPMVTVGLKGGLNDFGSWYLARFSLATSPLLFSCCLLIYHLVVNNNYVCIHVVITQNSTHTGCHLHDITNCCVLILQFSLYKWNLCVCVCVCVRERERERERERIMQNVQRYGNKMKAVPSGHRLTLRQVTLSFEVA